MPTFDKDGLLVQQDFDGGDTLAHTAFWAMGNHASNGTDVRKVRGVTEAIEKCHVGHGLWVRHPKPGLFWSDPRLTTRDQLLLTFVMLRLAGEWGKLAWTTLRLFCRLGLAQNTRSSDYTKRLPDIAWPQLGVVIRSWFPFSLPFGMPILALINLHNPWLWVPVLWWFDLAMLIGVSFDVIPWRWKDEEAKFVRRSPNDVDDDNCVGQLAAAILWMPSPLSWLARKLHAHRPWNLGCELTPGAVSKAGKNFYPPVIGALRQYHRAESGGNPDVANVWVPFIERYWYGKK